MNWIKKYKNTPAISTSERLPGVKDAARGYVLARRAGVSSWQLVRWSEVTRDSYQEWRIAEFTDEHRARAKEWNRRALSNRKAPHE